MNRLPDWNIPDNRPLSRLPSHRDMEANAHGARQTAPAHRATRGRLLPLLLISALLLLPATGCGRGTAGTDEPRATASDGAASADSNTASTDGSTASTDGATEASTAAPAASASPAGTTASPTVAASPVDSGASTATDASGPKFPDFTLKDINGNTVDQSVFANHALTMVNVWGTFCGPCIREMPDLGNLARELEANHDATVLGIVVDIQDADTLALARQITTDADADFTHLVPGADLNDFLSQFEYIPTTVFVDRNGTIVGETVVGGNSYDDYLAMVTDLLAP